MGHGHANRIPTKHHHPEAHQIISCVNAGQFSVTSRLREVKVLVGDTVDLTDRPLGQALLPQREV